MLLLASLRAMGVPLYIVLVSFGTTVGLGVGRTKGEKVINIYKNTKRQ
jgi:hypothetical protein